MVPFGRSVGCIVTVRVTSNPRTEHHVTVYRSEAAFTKIRPVPVDGSRSARNGDTRGGPVRRRATLRSVLDLSASSNVMLPSELTNAAVCVFPKKGNAKGTAPLTPSSSVSVRRVPSAARKFPSMRVTL